MNGMSVLLDASYIHRRFQVRDNILYILDADRYADEPVCYSNLSALLWRDRRMGHRSRMSDDRLDSPETFGKGAEPDFLEKRRGCSQVSELK